MLTSCSKFIFSLQMPNTKSNSIQVQHKIAWSSSWNYLCTVDFRAHEITIERQTATHNETVDDGPACQVWHQPVLFCQCSYSIDFSHIGCCWPKSARTKADPSWQWTIAPPLLPGLLLTSLMDLPLGVSSLPYLPPSNQPDCPLDQSGCYWSDFQGGQLD